MNFLELSDEFFKEAEKHCSYDENIPLQYRIINKLLNDNDYRTAQKFIEVNKKYFENEYNYLLLDLAVEHSIDTVVNEDGNICNTERSGKHIYRPAPEAVSFIEYLLINGADPNLPKNFNQMEHINDVETDGSQQCECKFDCSEIKLLIGKYM